jgi:hypothetical protein
MDSPRAMKKTKMDSLFKGTILIQNGKFSKRGKSAAALKDLV